MVKLIIGDESPVSRYLIRKILEQDSELEIIGEARNGQETIELVAKLHPDVVTFDINMSDLSGLELTKKIMQDSPLPIVGLTNDVVEESATIRTIINAGALTVIEKPKDFMKNFNELTSINLINSLKLMAEVKVVRRLSGAYSKIESIIELAEKKKQSIEIIGIATSTGGPDALAKLLNQLPDNFDIPILIVQHIMKGFTNNFVTWLKNLTGMNIKIAEQHEPINPNVVYIAPDDTHLGVNNFKRIVLSQEKPQKGHRPSANYLFNSLAKNFKQRCMGIILTGMGDDGAEGLKAIKIAGGVTLAQDEKSCVIFGMPSEAINLNAVDQVVSIDKIGKKIQELIHV